MFSTFKGVPTVIFTYVLYLPYWLTLGTGQFLYGKAKRSFRDWPFVCFSGGFISHLFGDYANIKIRLDEGLKFC